MLKTIIVYLHTQLDIQIMTKTSTTEKEKEFLQQVFIKGDIVAKVQTKSNYRGMNGSEFKVVRFDGRMVELQIWIGRITYLTASFSLDELTSIRTCF